MAKKKYHPDLRIIRENDFGYIGICPCCKEVQFCIGNLISFMPVIHFLKLYHSFQRIHDKLKNNTLNILEMPNGNKITLQTPIDNFLLSLSIDEFLQIIDLFDAMSTNLKLAESLEKIENLN